MSKRQSRTYREDQALSLLPDFTRWVSVFPRTAEAAGCPERGTWRTEPPKPWAKCWAHPQGAHGGDWPEAQAEALRREGGRAPASLHTGSGEHPSADQRSEAEASRTRLALRHSGEEGQDVL